MSRQIANIKVLKFGLEKTEIYKIMTSIRSFL